ncbi:MAG: hypothetical protein FJ044_05025 [Candidatus Cloacimonetes bacterium]|nr:hypothetical protein [Candidatus Cloacimonadota bacterium]
MDENGNNGWREIRFLDVVGEPVFVRKNRRLVAFPVTLVTNEVGLLEVRNVTKRIGMQTIGELQYWFCANGTEPAAKSPAG